MSHQPPRVLIVDDNALSCDLLRYQLQDHELQLDFAENGEQALLLLAEQRYTVVLMDLHMPLLGGREAIRRLRAKAGPNKDSPVLALTAQTLDSDMANLLQEGFTDVLYKPLELDGLLETLGQFCPDLNINSSQSRQTTSESPWQRVLERANGSAALARLLLERLMDELPDELSRIGAALQQQKKSLALELVHKVHGSAAYYGLSDIKASADALERLLLKGDESQYHAAYRRFSSTIEGFLRQRAAIMAEAERSLG